MLVLCIMPWDRIMWSGCGCDRLLLMVACVDVEGMLCLSVEGFWCMNDGKQICG